MLAARALNQNEQTMYGAYILGRHWFFLTLDGRENTYAISPSLDAASEDIFTIYAVLDKLKAWIASQA